MHADELQSTPMNTEGAEPTAAAEPADEPVTALGHAGDDSETQSIHAWSLTSDDDADTEVIERRSWRLPVALAAAALVAVSGAGGYVAFKHHAGAVAHQGITPRPVPAPQVASSNPLILAQIVGQGTDPETGQVIPGSKVQLQGEPANWTAVEDDLHQQGINIEVNAVGIVTSLNFANLDTAPNNWLRWYAKHVSTEKNPRWEPAPSEPPAWYFASEAGLPVPPPPRICYSANGMPIADTQFLDANLGPHSECGHDPAGM